MSVILPNICANPKDIAGPFFYFAGPVLGGGDWQYECYKKIAERLGENFCAAIPMRYPADHSLVKLRLPSHGHYPRQLPWERFYLEEAGIFRPQGCIVLYVPVESTAQPRSDGLPYAMDTRDEIAEWRTRMMYDPRKIRFVVGIEPGFLGREISVRRFDKALNGHFKVYGTLDETVEAAIKIVTPDERSTPIPR